MIPIQKSNEILNPLYKNWIPFKEVKRFFEYNTSPGQ